VVELMTDHIFPAHYSWAVLSLLVLWNAWTKLHQI